MAQELMIGLVGAIGVDLDEVTGALGRALHSVGYKSKAISLIEPVFGYDPWSNRPSPQHFDDRYNARMDAGNEFRAKLERADALALLGMVSVEADRKAETGDEYRSPERFAYILRSLKTKAEVDTFRRVYGPNLVVVGAYSPKDHRRTTLAERIARSHHDSNNDRHLPAAQRLMLRDEIEHGNSFGQNVRDTFPLSDVFIDAGSKITIEAGVTRFVEILFGHPFRTPRREESGMLHAYAAGLRSASAGRQVGAAILTKDGDLVAVGTNEVAKAGGGQYWDGDDYDHRDHTQPSDVASRLVESILADTLARLKKKGWLEDARAKRELSDLLAEARKELLKPMQRNASDLESLAESARFGHVIEYIRAVHAEMAALMSAARRGISVQGCTLYSTAFPCHECARHIVASGIAEVRFVEPYPKSRVSELFSDSIVVDAEGTRDHVTFRAYIGISPTRYMDLFVAPRRHDDDDKLIEWETIKGSTNPRLGNPLVSYLEREKEHVDLLNQLKKSKNISGT